ncbi:Gti1/Pac2 family-domain-containing protein [Durotheca rogersii]|uniref:Gti1/Pac2 family-domain-containing protein n=1 Tax=Durotheca rogersii TaxID=419775 RepID=UPI00221ED21F|nr:Gti1/Pac2 family-domain-containing protein [Durotheca rogersii]KAI5859332.1 Gti1/Pac2 family-domain-containing protein [Durotheca rogersii]
MSSMIPGSAMLGGQSGPALGPTFIGYIGSTMDALILFEACLCGRFSHVPRRPHDRERPDLIVSGNVFIYEEHSSGIKRWTDGVPWSPSRILGNFLLYRELDKPFQPGEKKRAMKRQRPCDGSISKPTPNSRTVATASYTNFMAGAVSMADLGSSVNTRNDAERALVGSLVDSYQFKQEGLIKKTISVSHRGVQHHLVSYYTIKDVLSGKLTTPTEAPSLLGITPRPTLISSGNFRAPVDDHEYVLPDQSRGPATATPPYGTYTFGDGRMPSSLIPSGNFRAPVDDHEYLLADHPGRGPTSTTPPYGTYSFGDGRMPSTPAPNSYAPANYANPYIPPSSYNMSHGPPPISYAPVTTSYNYDQTIASYGMAPRSPVSYNPPPSASTQHPTNFTRDSFDGLCPWYYLWTRDNTTTLTARCQTGRAAPGANLTADDYHASKLVLGDCITNEDGTLVSSESGPRDPGPFSLQCPGCGLVAVASTADSENGVQLVCQCIKKDQETVQLTSILLRNVLHVRDGTLTCAGRDGSELTPQEEAANPLPVVTVARERTVTANATATVRSAVTVTTTTTETTTVTPHHLFTVTSSAEPGVISAGLRTTTVVWGSFTTVTPGAHGHHHHHHATSTAPVGDDEGDSDSDSNGDDNDEGGDGDEGQGEDGGGGAGAEEANDEPIRTHTSARLRFWRQNASAPATPAAR